MTISSLWTVSLLALLSHGFKDCNQNSVSGFEPITSTRKAISRLGVQNRINLSIKASNDDWDNGFDDNDWLKPSNSAPPPQRRESKTRRSGRSRQDRNGAPPARRQQRQKSDEKFSNHKENFRSSRESSQPAAITDTNAHFFSKKSLQDPSLKMAGDALFMPLCKGAGITRPSRIQSLAWPNILSGNHTLVADQTGSGKTLAYLIPLLQKALSTDTKTKPGAPKVLILAPTAELADQIQEVCHKLASEVAFSTMVITATGKFQTSIRDQIRRLQRTPVDVLISTPGRISTILRTRNSGLDLSSNLQAIVLDEVDILLIDETFGPQLRAVGEAAPPLEDTQFVFVTATLPEQIVQTVESEFPGVVQVRGPGLHRTAPSLAERLVDVSVPAEYNRNAELCFDVKAKELLLALRQNRCRRTLIFCNTVESCRDVENLLSRKDRKGVVYEVGAYHNAMTPERRNANLDIFAKGRHPSSSDGRQGNRSGGQVDYVLICTDRAARGVDFSSSPVDHVVIFDFPKDPAEYVRRVGRTARAGRPGTSTVFAYGWQLPVARQMMGQSITTKSGKKALHSDTISSFNDLGETQADEDLYKFRKDRRTRKSMDAMIKEHIESGRLWGN